MSKIYVGDVGTEILADCGTNITDAIAQAIKVTFPDGTQKEWPAQVYETDYLKYTLMAEDTVQAGVYTAQTYVETASGKWSGETFKFRVYALGR